MLVLLFFSPPHGFVKINWRQPQHTAQMKDAAPSLGQLGYYFKMMKLAGWNVICVEVTEKYDL